jgi:hypothetical protein
MHARFTLGWIALGLAACSSASHGGAAGATSDSGSDASTGSGSSSGSGGGSSSGSTTSVEGGAGIGPDGGTLFDPTEVARVAGWLSNPSSGLLSYAYTNIDMYFPVGPARDRLVDSIVGACAAFAPRLPDWQEYCEAIEASEIVAESSYNPGTPTPGPPTSGTVVYDSYATENGSNDPTVGLLQVRFSSTVHDFNYYGPLPEIEAIGCNWPAALTTQADVTSFWRTQGGTVDNLTFMEDPACNIPLACWYVFMNATGNGGANAVYANNYCDGMGVAGNVVVGLISYLEGPGFTRPADPTNSYPAGIKTQFAALLGGLPSPDPFGVTLSPDESVYCK